MRLASRLDHPTAVGVLDFDIDERDAWYTMPYVAGISLARVVDRIHSAEDP